MNVSDISVRQLFLLLMSEGRLFDYELIFLDLQLIAFLVCGWVLHVPAHRQNNAGSRVFSKF